MTTQSVKVRLCGKTDIGCVRTNNEDSLLVLDLTEGYTPLPQEELTRNLIDNRLILAVADGMGGAAAGEVASAIAVNALREEFVHFPGVGTSERLKSAIEQIHSMIIEVSSRNRRYQGMATTLTAALVEGGKAYIAEVGDSRAYIIRGGRIKQITTDQSWVELMIEQGYLQREEASSSRNRNVILQSLGGQGHSNVKVALTAVELAANDILLLCSDGLSEKVTNEEMMQILYTSQQEHDAKVALAAACDELIMLAKVRGGNDNITVALAHFRGEGFTASPDATDLISHIEVISVFDHVADTGVRDTRKFSSELRGKGDFKTTIRVKKEQGGNYAELAQLLEQAEALSDYLNTFQLALEQQLHDLDRFGEWQLSRAKLDLNFQQSVENLRATVTHLEQLQSALNECNKNLEHCTENS